MKTNKISWPLVVVTFLVVIATVVYIEDARNNLIKTSIVTWIVVLMSTLLNLTVIVVREKKFKLAPNIVIVTGASGQAIILLSILIMGAGTKILSFDICTLLGSVLGFSIFLWKRKHAMISAIAINAAIVIGFFPLWKNLWYGGAVESLLAWIVITIASAIGLWEPLRKKNYLSLVYPARATLTGLSVVLLSL